MRTKCPARSISDFRYSPLVAALAVALAPQAAMATTKAVKNGSDSISPAPAPADSLREALEYFNVAINCTGADTINFDFSNGAFTVNVSEPLPIISCNGLTINGSVPLPDTRAVVRWGGGFASGAFDAETASPVNVQNLQVDGFTYGTALLGNINAGNNLLTSNATGYDPRFHTGLNVVDNVIQSNTVGIRLSSTSNILVDSNQVLNSSSSGIFVNGASNVTIRGNTVSANQKGIYVSYGGSTVTIDGNTITSNSNAVSFDSKGIYLESSSAVVNNNLISGNDYPVFITSDRGTRITNNRIGSTDNGFGAMGNKFGITFGRTFFDTSSNTVISGNVISANRDFAIDLGDFVGVKITGNKIGTTIDGVGALGNSGGIIAYCGTGIEISGNVISGNSNSAIEFGAVQGGGKLNIVDNKIGVTGDGVTALGNNAYGVNLRFGGCEFSPSGGSGNLLIRGNTIANNTADGVLVSNGTGNFIVENLIYGNGGKNLNLGSPGPLPRPNDALDGDIGPNNGQNFPVLGSAVRDWPGGFTMVGFTLDGPVGNYRIDIYSNGSVSSPGGKIYHGSTFLPIAIAGPTPGSFAVAPLNVSNRPNNFSVTATAVATNDTSEFSPTAFITLAPAVTITPNPVTLNFGQVSVGSQSPPQSITLRSTGNEPYRINRMRLNNCFGPLIYGGPFMISSTCSANADYVPGQQCQITARFAPIALGAQSTTIAICDNTLVYGGRSFTLNGTGGEPPPVTVLPSEFDFGSVLAGSRSAPQQFVISNPSPSVVSIGPVTVSSGDFVIDASTCGTSIPSGGLCAALVRFAPSQPVRSNATLSVAASGAIAAADKLLRIASSKAAAGGSASAFLTGLGIQVADIQLPAAIDFGAYTLGTAPIRRTVEILNTGNAVVSFNNISVTGPFVLGNNCPANIGPGEQCQLTLDFSATTLGEFSGVLAVVSNAIGGTRSIPLTAHSVAIAAPQLSVSPLTISFGDRLLGTTSGTQRVTIRNIGNAPALIGSITASADFVVIGNTCSLALAPTSTCFADVALRPVGFGPRAGQLFIASSAADSPNVVTLRGTGCRPFSSSSSRFGMGSGFNCAP